MGFVALLEAARGDRVGEDKKCFFGPKFSVESLDEEIVLVIQHCLETHAADIALRRSINRIAECHVVGRHGLGDSARCAAHAKESARYFLSRTNFSERPILGWIQIDVEGLLISANLHLWIHTFL